MTPTQTIILILSLISLLIGALNIIQVIHIRRQWNRILSEQARYIAEREWRDRAVLEANEKIMRDRARMKRR